MPPSGSQVGSTLLTPGAQGEPVGTCNLFSLGISLNYLNSVSFSTCGKGLLTVSNRFPHSKRGFQRCRRQGSLGKGVFWASVRVAAR